LESELHFQNFVDAKSQLFSFGLIFLLKRIRTRGRRQLPWSNRNLQIPPS